MFKIKKSILFLGIITFVASFFIFARFSPIARAQETGPQVWGGQSGSEYMAETGLQTQDIRITIAKIIRVVLGFLGIIALIIIIYAGYLWMMAGGNAEQIETAKKWMINAVIGLIIVLSSFAIASFVLSRLTDATGNEGSGGNVEDNAILPISPGYMCADPAGLASSCATDACRVNAALLSATPYVCGISPTKAVIGAYITIAGYHFNIYDKEKSKVEFYSANETKIAEVVVCPGNNNYNWTDSRIVIKVPELTAGIYSIKVTNKDGNVNAAANQKVFQVLDGNIVPPGIACILPDEGKENEAVEIFGDYFGDVRGSSEVVFADDIAANIEDAAIWSMKKIIVSVPSGAISGAVIVKTVVESESEGVIEAQSNGYPFKVVCAASNECASGCCYNSSFCANVDYCVGQSCDNNKATSLCEAGNCGTKLVCDAQSCACKSPGEGDPCDNDLTAEGCQAGTCAQGLTCAQDCICKKLPGQGEACANGTKDSCSEGQCDSFSACDEASCLCLSRPVISWISPDNGAGGNLITLGGVNFGNEKGTIIFVSKTDSVETSARLAGEVNKDCSYNDWTDTKIIVEIPSSINLGDYEVRVVASKTGLGDKKDFKVNNIIRPGLCAAYKTEGNNKKEEGQFKDEITLAGVNLGNINKINEITFGNEVSGTNPIDEQFTNKTISIEGIGVPNLIPNLTTIFVKDENNGNASNPVNFTILESSSTPKISYFSPGAGHSGDYVTIYGKGFGSVQRTVKFGDAAGDFLFPQECLTSLWKDDRIIVKVPAGIAAGEYNIKVKINDADELISSEKFHVGNYCSKDFLTCPEEMKEGEEGVEEKDGCEKGGRGICVKNVSPGLCKINPAKGPAKTPVTFFGENFGVLEADGKKSNALFNDKAGEKSVAPSAWINGGNGTNKADQATANVPDEPRSGDIKIVNALGLASNGLHFDAGSCVGENGQPNNNKCPANEFCCGANSYFKGACVSSASDCGPLLNGPSDYVWTFTTKAPSSIPKCGEFGAQTDCESNGYCCWNETSCGNNCPPSQLLQVKEQCYTGSDCAANAVGPSPSPWNKWPNGESTCVDAIIRAEFSAEIEQDTLNKSNIIVFECASENSCANVVAGKIEPSVTGFSFTANENLNKNTWYQVTLKASNGIKAKDKDGQTGKFLDGDKNGEPGGDYTWKFKTRDDATPCEIGCPVVLPDKYRAENKSRIKYNGSFTAKDNKCVILNGKSKSWNWMSDSPKAAISSERDCCAACDLSKTNWACVKPLKETNGEKINITGNVKIGDQSESAYGELTIDFQDFSIKEIWPAAGCDGACLNSAVAAKFSGEVDMTTVSGNFLIEGEEGIKGKEGEEGSNNREIVFKDLSLKVNTDYRVIIKGGEGGIKNANGGKLAGLNYDSNNDKINDSFSWAFKTADKECAVNSVELDPAEAYVENIGDAVKYWANPFSTPDKCSQSGQRLNTQSYSWVWSKGDMNGGIAKISVADQGKGYNSVTAIDGPTAPENKATVKINATEEKSGVIGSGDFTIICGYEYGNAAHDAKCEDGKAVAKNGCCYDRPGIVEIQPEATNNVINNFCLNGLIKVKFNQLMDESALKNALILKKHSADGQCSQSLSMTKFKGAVAGAMRVNHLTAWEIIDQKFMFIPKFLISEFISPSRNINNYFFADMTLSGASAIKYGIDKMLALAKGLFNTAGAAGDGWCDIGQKIIPNATVWNGKKVTEITIIPDNLLVAHNASLTYDYQLNFSGLKSRQGISLIHDPVNIKTGAEICRIDHVDVVIDNTSEGRSITKDIFTCAGRNTCGGNTEIAKDDDANSAMAGNQHLYDASAIDAYNNPLNVQKYVWMENDLNVSQDFPDGAVKLSQASNINGNQIKNQRWVTANPITQAAASFEIGAYYGNMNDDYYSKATTTVDVTLFMCENPWPSIDSFPYEDNEYNFSSYYCRDSNNVNNPTDDLPGLGDQNPSGQIKVCKDGTLKAGLRCANDAACEGLAGGCASGKCVNATPNAGNDCANDKSCGAPSGSCELKILKEYLWVED